MAALGLVSALLIGAAAVRAEVPAGALAEGALDDGEPRVAVRLLIHPDDVGSRQLRMGVLFEMDPGWHIYWRNPGDSGLATEISWSSPGATFSELSWPSPQLFEEADGLFTTYGYKDRVLLATTARYTDAVGESQVVTAVADVLACKDECIPASLSLSRTIASARSVPASNDAVSAFTRHEQMLPSTPEAAGFVLEVQHQNPEAGAFESRLELACQPGATHCRTPERVQFIPGPGIGRAFEPSEWRAAATRSDALGEISLRGTAEAESPDEISGVLLLASAAGESQGLRLSWNASAAAAASADFGALSWLRALLFALVGGLILNLMPCVLPVLAIKVVAVAELAEKSRRQVVMIGLAYTSGILLTMLGFAAVVLALRSAGHAVGWGFQFQEPLFVAGVSTVLIAFSLNLFGVFEINFHGGRLAGLGQDSGAIQRSFFEGLLAVVLATPCTAPFLGTAVGFAFASGSVVIVTIFSAIGLGLALPFLAVSLVPCWARFMPRAGGWVLQLRSGLGFALLATCVWLLWILGRSVGVDGLSVVMAWLVTVAFAIWLHSVVQKDGHARITAAMGTGLILLALIGINAVGVTQSEASGKRGAGAWQVWSPEAVRKAVEDEGRVAFVDFTADWCLTCAANKRLVLSRERIQQALKASNVALFKADWTRRDETIRRELARHGKSGVPLNLVFSPGQADQPLVLPEVLTVDLLLDALLQAAPGSAQIEENTPCSEGPAQADECRGEL